MPNLTTIARLSAILAFSLMARTATLCAQSDDDYINPDRPGIADGSTTVGRGHFQFETALQSEWRRKGAEHDRTIFIPTLLRYGFAAKWEARVEGNSYTWKRQDDPQKGT